MASADDYDLGTKRAAKFLTDNGFPVHQETVRRWAEAGKLHHLRTPGGQLRFRRADLLALVPPREPDPAEAAS